MLNSLMVERVTADQTNGAYSMLEQWVTADGNPPPHLHTHEDEVFLVVEGELDGTAHLYVIASPGGIEGFFRDLGEPAAALELPAPSAPDVPAVVSTAARYGISILRPSA